MRPGDREYRDFSGLLGEGALDFSRDAERRRADLGYRESKADENSHRALAEGRIDELEHHAAQYWLKG